jgi:hypothetical protein
MSEFVPQFGTDNGPACAACKGTVYGYRVTGETTRGPSYTTVAVRCIGCHAMDYFRPRIVPATAAQCSEEHRTAKLPELTIARIKPGDVLIRERDHLARPDDRVTVTAIAGTAPRSWRLTGYFRDTETAKSICAQGFRIVERGGTRVGTFFTKYW